MLTPTATETATLFPPKWREQTDALLNRGCRQSLLACAIACDPKYEPSQVHKFIAEKLEAVARGKITRLVITCPPRHGKSRLTSIEFTSWLLGHKPTAEIVLASYSAGLAVKWSKETRDRIETSTRYQAVFPATKVNQFDRSADAWRTTAGGGFRSVGIEGGLTGFGADLLIIDDFCANHEEAHSHSQREKVWDWYRSTAYTRLLPGGAIIIIATRWHVDDLIGRVLSPERAEEMRESGMTGDKWELVNLPALAEENDPLGRAEGEALWPERFPKEEIERKTVVLGSYLASALYQCAPVPKGGHYINGKNFVILDRSQFPTGHQSKRYWDLAAKAGRLNDFTAGVRGFMDSSGTIFIEDVQNHRLEWPRAKAIIRELADNEGIPVGIEAVSGFAIAYQELRAAIRPDVPMTQHDADKDKLTRALPWIAMTEARKVVLARAPWNAGFIEQCEAFPQGDFDDQVDSMSGLYGLLKTTPFAYTPVHAHARESRRF